MKPVVYKTTKEAEILAEGDYNGRHYYILWCETHPTAYVEFRYEFSGGSDEYYNTPCHDGITYCDLAHWNKDDQREYIGWSYGNCCDYKSYFVEYPKLMHNEIKYKKWTIEEIFEEVKKVIDYLNKIKKGDKEDEN